MSGKWYSPVKGVSKTAYSVFLVCEIKHFSGSKRVNLESTTKPKHAYESDNAIALVSNSEASVSCRESTSLVSIAP